MADDTTPPRRRKLPVLGMTTVGLAVGAGSLGLYRGAPAEQPPPAADQPTWTTAARPASPPEGAAPEPAAPAVIAASYAEPAAPPAAIAPVVTAPPIPSLPVVPAAPAVPVAPAAPAVPVVPAMAVPDVPALPATPAALSVPSLPALPAMPIVPAAAEKPAAASPKVPAPVAPAPAAKQWPQVPDVAETLPPPREVKPASPLTRLPDPVDSASKTTSILPLPVPVTPVAPVTPVPPTAQSVRLPATPAPVTPIVPAKPELNLPSSQPGFTVNSEPEAKPTRQAPGVLSSLKSEPPGDAPVKPPLQSLKAAAVGVALAAAPVNAADPPADKIPPVKVDAAKVADPVADLKAEVQKLREDAALERKFRMAIEDMVNGNRDNETGKSAPGLAKKVADLDTRLKALEEKFATFDAAKFQATLDRLDTKLTELGNAATTAQKPEKPAAAAPKPMPGPKATVAGKATVRIVNEFPVPISLKVNDKSYRVEPNATELVEVPAGEYTYELLNTGSPAVTRTLKESQSETLRIK